MALHLCVTYIKLIQMNLKKIAFCFDSTAYCITQTGIYMLTLYSVTVFQICFEYPINHETKIVYVDKIFF